MLRIYPVCIEVSRLVRPLADRVAGFDRAKAFQLRKSCGSIINNVAEGSGLRAGRRRVAYEIALGEARETLANLEAAEAMGYVPPLAPDLRARFTHIIGTLVRIVHPV